MHDTFAPRIDPTMLPETPARRLSCLLYEAAGLSDPARAALAGEQQICLETAFDLFIEARSEGYRSGTRRLDRAQGESWRRASGAKSGIAKRIWTRFLGNPAFADIERKDVVHALERIRNLPKHHGKRRSEHADLEVGMGEEPPDPDRIGTSTFLRCGRTARQVGDFLVGLELADENPFDICRWSMAEETRLRQQERPAEPRYCSEAVESFLSSPIFKGEMSDPGDPLFWVPLLMRLGGLRLGEAIGLRTRDLRKGDCWPVLCIDLNTELKEPTREVPVSRRLAGLGLEKLFELRRRQNETALFPQLASNRSGVGTAQFRRRFVSYCGMHGIDTSFVHPRDFRRALHRALLERQCTDHVVRSAMGQASGDTRGKFLDDSLLHSVHAALSQSGDDLPDIVGPFR